MIIEYNSENQIVSLNEVFTKSEYTFEYSFSISRLVSLYKFLFKDRGINISIIINPDSLNEEEYNDREDDIYDVKIILTNDYNNIEQIFKCYPYGEISENFQVEVKTSELGSHEFGFCKDLNINSKIREHLKKKTKKRLNEIEHEKISLIKFQKEI